MSECTLQPSLPVLPPEYLRWLEEDEESAQKVADAWNDVFECGKADLAEPPAETQGAFGLSYLKACLDEVEMLELDD